MTENESAEKEQKSEKPVSEKKVNLIYAALLLNSAGKEISEENVKSIVSVVSDVDNSQIKALVAALDGVDINDAISRAAVPAAVSSPASAPAEEKKEQKSEEDMEKKSEEAAAGLGALFG